MSIKMSDTFKLPVRFCDVYDLSFNEPADAAIVAINSYDANQERIKELEAMLRSVCKSVSQTESVSVRHCLAIDTLLESK